MIRIESKSKARLIFAFAIGTDETKIRQDAMRTQKSSLKVILDWGYQNNN